MVGNGNRHNYWQIHKQKQKHTRHVYIHTIHNTRIQQLIHTINNFRVLDSSNWRSARKAIATFFYGIGFHVTALIYTILKWNKVSSIQIRFLFISFYFLFFSFLTSYWQSPIIRIQIKFNRIDNFSALFISFAHLTDWHFQKWHRKQMEEDDKMGLCIFTIEISTTYLPKGGWIYSGSINRIFVARSIKIYHLKLRFTLYAHEICTWLCFFSHTLSRWSLFSRCHRALMST